MCAARVAASAAILAVRAACAMSLDLRISLTADSLFFMICFSFVDSAFSRLNTWFASRRASWWCQGLRAPRQVQGRVAIAVFVFLVAL